MADTKRSLSALQTLLADNTNGDISPQDVRDMLVSCLGVYGSLYTKNNTTHNQQDIGSTLIKFTGFDNNGFSQGVTPDATNNKLTATVAGNYLVFAQISFSGTNGSVVKFRIFNNTTETNYGCTRQLGGTDTGSASVIGIVTCAANDELSLYVSTDGATDDIQCKDANMFALMIG